MTHTRLLFSGLSPSLWRTWLPRTHPTKEGSRTLRDTLRVTMTCLSNGGASRWQNTDTGCRIGLYICDFQHDMTDIATKNGVLTYSGLNIKILLQDRYYRGMIKSVTPCYRCNFMYQSEHQIDTMPATTEPFVFLAWRHEDEDKHSCVYFLWWPVFCAANKMCYLLTAPRVPPGQQHAGHRVTHLFSISSTSAGALLAFTHTQRYLKLTSQQPFWNSCFLHVAEAPHGFPTLQMCVLQITQLGAKSRDALLIICLAPAPLIAAGWGAFSLYIWVLYFPVFLIWCFL